MAMTDELGERTKNKLEKKRKKNALLCEKITQFTEKGNSCRW